MEIEITQEEYEKYLKNKNINQNIKPKFKIGDPVQLLKDNSKYNIYIVDFYYFNRENYNRNYDNKLIYASILYYIIHNKDTNIKYTVQEKDIVPYKGYIRHSLDFDKKYKEAIKNKYDK